MVQGCIHAPPVRVQVPCIRISTRSDLTVVAITGLCHQSQSSPLTLWLKPSDKNKTNPYNQVLINIEYVYFTNHGVKLLKLEILIINWQLVCMYPSQITTTIFGSIQKNGNISGTNGKANTGQVLKYEQICQNETMKEQRIFYLWLKSTGLITKNTRNLN